MRNKKNEREVAPLLALLIPGAPHRLRRQNSSWLHVLTQQPVFKRLLWRVRVQGRIQVWQAIRRLDYNRDSRFVNCGHPHNDLDRGCLLWILHVYSLLFEGEIQKTKREEAQRRRSVDWENDWYPAKWSAYHEFHGSWGVRAIQGAAGT